ncbi:hypothetical protein A3C17_00525 [Candidatus Uhrbacteria bacterium RIFCSPHIGHO2_02_FULL_53_13]|uniref:Zinc ABC transporter substrate-binding protein n=1 Tax=Candidatus Uhrbacteria bacterium RIFCSPHIGHO2_02_FULL_53_13 TaxID=1802389 RepID=A0A1F7U016_9BACT|nr:MAG: hypothetical protein A3C17_00525 [Candidatus Uhrbacteria bacterium RIFCSPHIGHO2_02_FULL_53_13]
MPKIIPWIVVIGVLAIVIVMGALSLASSRPQAQADVAATIFPLYDLARTIAEPETSVALVLDPGASPHTFEVTPRKATELAHVDTIFAIGNGLDGWVSDVANISDASIVTVDDGIELLCIEEDGVCDPHYWLDAQNAIAIAQTIRDTLIARDPAHAQVFAQRTQQLMDKLKGLDAELTEQFGALEHTDIITFHDGFGYFAAAYGLNIRGVFEPSPGREPSAQSIAKLHELVSVYTIRTLYREPQLSDASIMAFVEDVDVSIATLDPIGGVEERQNYFELLRYNARVLQETLNTGGDSR